MVHLSNSGDISRRYDPYILELREFFAMHDVLCGAPRELGFLAARLTGRDSFPDELGSMVRSIIFREGGAVTLPDLLTVVALAVGGPAVADSAPELQHPLNDLASFLASVARTMLDRPSFAAPLEEPEAAKAPAAAPAATNRPAKPPLPTGVRIPDALPDAFVFPKAPAAALATAAFAGSDLRKSNEPKVETPAALLEPAPTRRKLWAAGAIGLPLLLLAAFLYYQSALPTASPYPEAQAPSTAPSTAPAAIAAPNAAPQTSLAAAAAALAQPPSSGAAHLDSAFPSLGGRPRISAAPLKPLSPATPVDSPQAPAAEPSPSRTATASTVSLPSSASPAAAAAPPPAAASSPSASPVPAHATHAAAATSVVTAIAQQGAFGVSSGIMSSHLISFSPPKYPAMAGFTHAQGQVILQAVVAKTGRVIAVKAITGPRTLRKAAETAVRQWRYRPYVTEGHAEDIATIITIDIKSPH